MYRLQRLVHPFVCILALAATAQARASGESDPAVAGAQAVRWVADFDASRTDRRLSFSRGGFDLGMHFASRPELVGPVDLGHDAAAPFAPTLPALSLGLRSVAAGAGGGSARRLLERATGATPGEGAVSRIGIEWKPAPSRFFLRHGLGVRLDDDDRLTMRLRKGSLGIYMRASF